MTSNDFQGFEASGRAVLSFLHERMGFNLWMITRTEGDDWIVLQSEDHGYGVVPGDVFNWADSFCSEMVKGNGPNIAPRSDEVPAYLAAPIGKQIDIKAYVGLPLSRQDGSLFGTLCAINPLPKSEAIVEEQKLLELLSNLLSGILQSELNRQEQVREIERLHAESMTDSLTGLYNRRGWDQLVLAEEERCSRYGHPAAAFVIDLNGLKLVNDTKGHEAGDDLIKRAGAVLHKAARAVDIVARFGGDEFGIVSIECNQDGANALLERIRNGFSDSNIEASIGVAMREPKTGLDGAREKADLLMYEEKRAGKRLNPPTDALPP